MKFLTAAKAYAALVGSILTGLAGIYGDKPWYAIALAVVTGIVTFAVPNARSADPTTSTPDL
jgi:hypothetical protein